MKKYTGVFIIICMFLLIIGYTKIHDYYGFDSTIHVQEMNLPMNQNMVSIGIVNFTYFDTKMINDITMVCDNKTYKLKPFHMSTFKPLYKIENPMRKRDFMYAHILVLTFHGKDSELITNHKNAYIVIKYNNGIENKMYLSDSQPFTKDLTMRD